MKNNNIDVVSHPPVRRNISHSLSAIIYVIQKMVFSRIFIFLYSNIINVVGWFYEWMNTQT